MQNPRLVLTWSCGVESINGTRTCLRSSIKWVPPSLREAPTNHSRSARLGSARVVSRTQGKLIKLVPRLGSREELATLEPAAAETEEQRNKFLVLRLYEALNARDHAAVQGLLAPDLEWWFHGPPARQHMMRILTGASSSSFRFVPLSVDAFGSTVIAEGPPATDSSRTYWVHAWTVGPDGVITQLREYFNTDLTVTRLAGASKCVWQSRRADRASNSLPGLVLAL